MPPQPDRLPDPGFQPEFYADIPLKRLLAWLIDVGLIGLISTAIVLFTGFVALFFLPFLFLAVSLTYRISLIANGSATLGMRVMAIELRRADASRFDLATATLHTGLYLVFFSIMPVQVASIILMLTDARARGLPDLILNTAAINRPARA